MSKKSRKINKKILAMLALAGGAAMAGRRKRNAAIDTGIASAEADKGSDMLPDAPVVKSIAPRPVNTGNIGNTITRTSGIKLSPTGQKIGAGGVNTAGQSRGVLAKMLQRGAMNKVPPSMRGGARHAAGYTAPVWSGQQYKHGGSVKKAKVTGIAKRGFGRALGRGKK